MDKSLDIRDSNYKRGFTSSSRPGSAYQEHFRRDQTRAIMNLNQNAKTAVNRNKLKLIAVLNFLTMGGIVFSLISTRWAYIYPQSNNKDTYYSINLLKDRKYVNNTEDSCDFIWNTKRQECDNGDKELCKMLGPYVFAGIGSTALVSVGLIFHCLSVIQIFFMGFRKECCLSQCLSPQIIQLGILLLYIGGFLFWWFGSGFFTKPFENFSEFLDSLGPSLASYLGSLLFYLILLACFQYLFKKTQRNAKLDELLAAENALLAQLDEGMLSQERSTVNQGPTESL